MVTTTEARQSAVGRSDRKPQQEPSHPLRCLQSVVWQKAREGGKQLGLILILRTREEEVVVVAVVEGGIWSNIWRMKKRTGESWSWREKWPI
jgi:hypothetical protein